MMTDVAVSIIKIVAQSEILLAATLFAAPAGLVKSLSFIHIDMGMEWESLPKVKVMHKVADGDLLDIMKHCNIDK